MKPSLIVHGGAWNIPDEAVDDCHNGIRRALSAGWKILSAGGAAPDAVEAAVVVMEDDATFDAGIGSHLNRDGRVQLDAIMMEGSTLKAGAVAAVERIRNPIRLARCILEKSDHMMLVAAGAEKFAAENGIPLSAPEDLVIDRERSAWGRCLEDSHAAEHHMDHEFGTVGAVALDKHGRLVAGTSTGGTCCKYPGRVGDSPLIGCGCYADAQAGGVSCTGHGEGIMKIVMAKMAVDLLAGVENTSPREESHQPAIGWGTKSIASVGGHDAQSVANSCVRRLATRAHTTGGLILLDRKGNPAAAFNTTRMAYGFVNPDDSFTIAP